MASDGSVEIEVNIDVSEAEKTLASLTSAITEAEKKMTDLGAAKGISEGLENAKEKAEELRETLDKAKTPSGKKSRGFFTPQEMEFNNNSYTKTVEKASTAQNEALRALENAKSELESLESQGKFFGDDEYDAAVKRLEKIKEDIRVYKEDLINPPKLENPFGLDTISGKLREAELELQRLSELGKGFGDETFDVQARKVSELREEYKAYQTEVTKTTAQREREAAVEAAIQKRVAEQDAKVAAQKEKEESIAREAERLAELANNATIANQDIVSLQQELASLYTEKSDYEKAGVGLGTEEYDYIVSRISEINGELNQYRRGLQESSNAAEEAAENVGRMADSGRIADNFMGKFSSRIKNLAKRVFVFSVITMALRSVRTYLSKVLKTNSEAQKSFAQLKGALLTLAQPIIEIIIPALVKLASILTSVISTVARLVSGLFGKTVEQSASAAEEMYNEAEAIESTGEAAQEASKYLSGLDEINTYSSESSSGGGAGASSDTAPDFGGVVQNSLDAVLQFITGAAFLAIGAILAFSGINIPLGITLMAIGAAFIADAAELNWETITQALSGQLGVILAIVSAALFAIGAILAFSGGNIPLGIALMAVGAAGLAAVIAVNWDTLTEALGGPVGAITTLLGAALLVLGAILAFTGANVPLGVGLIIAGAGSLAVAAYINWETIERLMRGPVGTVTAIVSGALLALGALLTFTGANIPMGIGMMIAGAVGLAAAIVPNWSAIINALQGPIGLITGIVSSVLLVLGIILLFTGAGIPLGLGLIAAGAAGLAAAIAPNWDFIVEKLKEMWDSIVSWWRTIVQPKIEAVGQFFTDVFTGIKDTIRGVVNGCIGFVEGLANSVIESINTVIRTLNNLSFDIPDWVPGLGGKKFGFSLKQLSKISIPRLAQGAVIPPNKSFLAVLGDQKKGTNVEAPLETIKQAVRDVIGNNRNNGNVTYEFVAQISRRVLFDEMITEAKLRQSKTGRNAFELV